MEPENDAFQKGISFSRDFFSGSMLNFRGVVIEGEKITSSWMILLVQNLGQSEVPKARLHGHQSRKLEFDYPLEV